MVYNHSTLYFLHFKIGLTKLCKFVFALFVSRQDLNLQSDSLLRLPEKLVLHTGVTKPGKTLADSLCYY